MHFVGVSGSFEQIDASNALVQAQVVPGLWRKLIASPGRPEAVVGDCHYGLVFVLPEEERAATRQLEYLAGLQIPETTSTPAGLQRKSTPAATYAIFEHHGPIKELARTIHFIFAQWLPHSAYQHAKTPELEVYDRRFVPESRESVMEYWIPVVARA